MKMVLLLLLLLSLVLYSWAIESRHTTHHSHVLSGWVVVTAMTMLQCIKRSTYLCWHLHNLVAWRPDVHLDGNKQTQNKNSKMVKLKSNFPLNFVGDRITSYNDVLSYAITHQKKFTVEGAEKKKESLQFVTNNWIFQCRCVLRAKNPFPCNKYPFDMAKTSAGMPVSNLTVSLNVMRKALYDWLRVFFLTRFRLHTLFSPTHTFGRLDVDSTQTSIKYCNAFITQKKLTKYFGSGEIKNIEPP